METESARGRRVASQEDEVAMDGNHIHVRSELDISVNSGTKRLRAHTDQSTNASEYDEEELLGSMNEMIGKNLKPTADNVH